MQTLTKCFVSLLICIFGTTGSFAGVLCEFIPFDSVDNGMGAEPGAVREFASGITVPPECLRGGRT